MQPGLRGWDIHIVSAGSPIVAAEDPVARHGQRGHSARICLVTGRGQLIEEGPRVEFDGQVTGLRARLFRIGLRADVATVVTYADQESILAGLRRRQIIIDSPRIIADDRAYWNSPPRKYSPGWVSTTPRRCIGSPDSSKTGRSIQLTSGR